MHMYSSRCMWLNSEHTNNSNRSKNIIFATTKIEFESANEFQKPPKSCEFISGRKVLTQRFAGKFSTWNPPSHAEGAHPLEQPRNQVSEMHFDKLHNPSTIQCWKTSFKTEVCSCSGFSLGSNALVDSVDDLKTSRSIRGHQCPNFQMLHAKIASSLQEIIQNSYFKKRVNLAEQMAQLEDRLLRGRQTALMIYEYFRVTGAHEAVLDYSDLFRITLHGDDVQDFFFKKGDVIKAVSKVSSTTRVTWPAPQ